MVQLTLSKHLGIQTLDIKRYTFDEGRLPTFAVKELIINTKLYSITQIVDVQLLNAWFGKILAGDYQMTLQMN